LNFAREKGVNLIIAGPSRRSFFQRVFKGSFLKELIGNSGSINILIAGQEKYDASSKEKYSYLENEGINLI